MKILYTFCFILLFNVDKRLCDDGKKFESKEELLEKIMNFVKEHVNKNPETHSEKEGAILPFNFG